MFKKIKKIIIPIILLIVTELFLYFQMISSKPSITIKYRVIYLIICILSNVFLLIALYMLNKKQKMKVENVFLTIAIIFGSLYLVFIPALLGTDELPHFLRPYQISTGDIIVKYPEKNETLIPKDIADFVGEKVMINRYSKKNTFSSTDYNNKINLWNGDVTSINYSPIPYLPQIIGFLISKLFKLSPLLTLFMVRFCNFATWLVLSYIAFKKLPTKKIFALILYTSPAILSIVSTCSGDALALALMFLLISYILNICKTERKFERMDFVSLLLISLGISTYKLFYVIYILLLFIIPQKCFTNKKEKILTLSLIVFLSFVFDAVWFFATSISNTISSNLVSNQISFILLNPIKYILIFVNTYINDIYYYATNIVAGSEMCYGLVRVNQLFVISYLFTLIASYVNNNEKINFNKSSKILISFVCLAVFGLVSTTLYLEWTAAKMGVGYSKIIGIQSRYFIALIIPILLLFQNTKKVHISDKKIINIAVVLDAILFIDCIKSLLIAVFPS